jgi:hypothetical protein
VVVPLRYGQHNLGEVFFAQEAETLCEPWMGPGDHLLEDEHVPGRDRPALRRLVGTNEIMRRTGKSKTCVRRWQPDGLGAWWQDDAGFAGSSSWLPSSSPTIIAI